jgi:hypothetical protein
VTRVRRLICVCAIAVFLVTGCASAASAQTFYVNKRNGQVTPKCGIFPGGHESSNENPCTTISAAVKKAEAVAGPNTIEVSAEENETEPFKEQIHLATAGDDNLTINGEEPGVRIVEKGAFAVNVEHNAGSVTISNVQIKGESAEAAVNDEGANVRLLDDAVEAESATNGVQAKGGSLTVEGGSAIMEADTGFAVLGHEAAVTVSGAKVISGDGGTEPESGGIKDAKGALVVKNTNVFVEGGPKTTQFGIVVEAAISTLIQNSSVRQGSPSIGVIFEGAGPTVEGLRVEMKDGASIVEGVLEEQATGASGYSHLEVLGDWKGPAMDAFAENVTLSDSHLTTNAAFASPALRYEGALQSQGLVVERSVLQAAPKAKPGTLTATTGNVTIDSSEILGGSDGVSYENLSGGSQTLTIAGSTIGPSPGVSFELPGVVGVEAAAKGTTANTVAVSIEGSIVFEPQVATVAHATNTASVTCGYSAVPSQIQTANALAEKGEVACAAGVSGNTNSSTELASLFAEIDTNFNLNPASSAVDSVPASAISLPAGVSPSATDLAGNPRVVDGNGDCAAVQDKGALELQGHSAPCPVAIPIGAPIGAKPLLGAITALTVSPSAFLPAPAGATISAKKGKPKRKYGAKISYRDSQAATTTFTILRKSAGRRQGKSCKKPSKRNKHDKRCTLLVKAGSFTHADTASANSFHFSGRLKGKKLAAGNYELQATAHNAAGNGPTVTKNFTIK